MAGQIAISMKVNGSKEHLDDFWNAIYWKQGKYRIGEGIDDATWRPKHKCVYITGTCKYSIDSALNYPRRCVKEGTIKDGQILIDLAEASKIFEVDIEIYGQISESNFEYFKIVKGTIIESGKKVDMKRKYIAKVKFSI